MQNLYSGWISNNFSLFSKSNNVVKRFSLINFAKKALLLSFTAIPVGNTSPQASFEKERHNSANIGYRSMSPVAVKSNLPAKRTKRLRASASARALAYSLYNVGSEVCKASIASLR